MRVWFTAKRLDAESTVSNLLPCVGDVRTPRRGERLMLRCRAATTTTATTTPRQHHIRHRRCSGSVAASPKIRQRQMRPLSAFTTGTIVRNNFQAAKDFSKSYHAVARRLLLRRHDKAIVVDCNYAPIFVSV